MCARCATTLTESLGPPDPPTVISRMSAAKRAEIRGSLERGTFKVNLKEEVSRDTNILPVRLLLPMKSPDDGNVKLKGRYVIGGH